MATICFCLVLLVLFVNADDADTDDFEVVDRFKRYYPYYPYYPPYYGYHPVIGSAIRATNAFYNYRAYQRGLQARAFRYGFFG
uniref:Uncharacterized protein n=1 Tax=Trichuris muris TaxID=70415 RepID=A0A5S6QV16_TRIMR